MSDKTVSLDYTNSLVFELEKALWDERGRGGRYRATTLGRDFFKDKCLQRIQTLDPEHIIRDVGDVLREAGIVAGIECSMEDRLLRLTVKGCIHQPVEQRMREQGGTDPFACLPANLIALMIDEKLDRPVELANIRVEGEFCHVLQVIFACRPKLDISK